MAFLSDTFTDTNGTNLQSHTGNTSHTWTKISGTNNAVIQSNALQGDGGSSGTVLYRASIAAATPDYQVSASLTTNTGTAHGICGRMNSAGTDFYLARYLQSAGEWQLFSFVSGTGTSIGTWAQVRSAGQASTVVLDMRGTTIRVLIDGTERISVTSSTVTAAGYVGVRLNELATGIMDTLVGSYVLVGLTEIELTDANLLAGLTPWNVVNGTTYLGFHHTPSGFNISFTGTQLRVTFDVSHLSPLSADNYPMVMYSVDNGAFTESKLTSTSGGFNLASGLSAGTHTVDFYIKKTASAGNVISQLAGPKIIAVAVSSGGSLAARTLPTDKILFYGDSITRGRGLDDGGVLGGDGIGAWPVAIAEALNCRHGIVGISGQGWTVTGTGGESDFEATWSDTATGFSRLTAGDFTDMPDMIVICHGTNDSAATDGNVTTAVTNTLTAIRAAAPDIPIFVLIPFSQTKKSAIQSGVVAAGGTLSTVTVFGQTISRCGTDTDMWMIDLGTGASLGIPGPVGSATQQANDGLHPDQRTVGRLAARIATTLAWAEQSSGGYGAYQNLLTLGVG